MKRMPFFTRPAGVLEFYTHGHGDEGDIPGNIGSEIFIPPESVPQFFAFAGVVSCGDWSTMTVEQRTDAMRRWLASRGIWIFDVPRNLGAVDDECARQVAERGVSKQERTAAERARAVAAELAATAARERERIANEAAAAYARTPAGRAEHLLGQIGMNCSTWAGSKDPSAKIRNIQFSLAVSEAEASDIVGLIDRYCSGEFSNTVAKRVFESSYKPPVVPTAPPPPAGQPTPPSHYAPAGATLTTWWSSEPIVLTKKNYVVGFVVGVVLGAFGMRLYKSR